MFPNNSKKVNLKEISNFEYKSENTLKNEELVSIHNLKKEILNITKENISENEKNQKIITLLKDYGIIPNNEKVKKIR